MQKIFNNDGVSYWAIIIVLAFTMIAMIVAFWPQDITTDTSAPIYVRLMNQAKTEVLEISEKAKIEKWIVDNNLNEYGEPADTLYAGGTPLFNEATGQKMERYEYIIKNHPDRPWNK
ncbi:hypothetical protein GYA54_00130 [Candidatus Kuenenbacteria bacterium]|nr:hypothetical protein [Candidatus Kuenenbacteria bacterium]